MLTENQISALRASFPAEALSADNSRGFELTSIKAAFVVERLNEVFGPCGCGWRYVHSPFEWIEGEVLTEVALQFHVDEGVNPVIWDAQTHGWSVIQDNSSWSWPIFSPGGRRPNKGNTPMTDARKGAITDGLTKAASMIGVGHQVFKGQVRVSEVKSSRVEQPTSSKVEQSNGFEPRTQPVMPRRAIPAKEESVPSNGNSPSNGANGNSHTNGATNGNSHNNGATGNSQPNGANGSSHSTATNGHAHGANGHSSSNQNDQVGSTAFWLFANSEAGKRVDRSTVSALAKTVIENRSSWTDALSKLKAMADGTATTKTLRLMETSDPLDMLFK